MWARNAVARMHSIVNVYRSGVRLNVNIMFSEAQRPNCFNYLRGEFILNIFQAMKRVCHYMETSIDREWKLALIIIVRLQIECKYKNQV